MRILIVDVNFDYKNPMYRQFYNSLSSCMEVDYFGPGYVTRECLENGINSFLNKREKYDAIMLGTYFVYSTGERGTRSNAYEIHRYTIPYYNVNDAYQCCGRIFQELKTLDNIIKIYIYYEDYCTFTKGDSILCQELIESNFYILSWPIEYLVKYSPKIISKYRALTNFFIEMVEKYTTKYIPISLHGINYNEIFVRNFASRRYEWCIPGNKAKFFYPERGKAYDILTKQQKKVWDDDPYQKLSVISIEPDHLYWYQFRNIYEMLLSLFLKKNVSISSFPKMKYIAACREQYLESMRSSKYVYSEGGIGNCFVRKYFEACACGAVLVAKKVPGMNEFGFIHEKNCLIVEKYDDIVHIDNNYSKEQLEKIANMGQKLILDKHMFRYRAIALANTIDAIKKGKYKGAYWTDGNYVLI